MPDLNLSDATAATAAVDAVIVGVHSHPSGPRPAPGSADVDAAFGGRLGEVLRTLDGRGKPGEVTKVPAAGIAAPLVVTVGLGAEPEAGGGYDHETLRRAAGAAVRSSTGAGSVAVALPNPDAAAVGVVAEGALLGAYAFLRYHDPAGDGYRTPVGDITVCTPLASDPAAAAAAERARVVADAMTLTRDLVNTPPSDLHPVEFADVAAATAAETAMDIDVLDEAALRDGGYGGILGVGQGSANPPRLARLAYTHPDARRTIAFVGKGITFDSGGLSLKPAAPMEWMKSDMGGAAAVLGALSAIGRLRPAVNVVGYLALAENMPSGTAQRPSDVLTMYGGKTVEVLNTDAEGRLVMADAIVRAGAEADLVIDVATLTGAQLVALGTRVGAAMANDDALRAAVVAAGGAAGDALWPMPLPDELRASLESGVADIANVSASGDRTGSMLQAGIFLREFVPPDVRWAHLDIAGPAFNQGDAHGYTPKGGTGAAMRTLLQVAEEAAAGRL